MYTRGPDTTTVKSSMAIRSVDEIINLSDLSKIPEKLAFKDLVKIIDPRIRDRAPRHSSLHFKIPGMLWGQPVFNADRVEKMIVRHYRNIGFKCARMENREILIKWGDADSKDADDTSADNSDTDSDGDNESESESDTDGDTEGDTDTDTDSAGSDSGESSTTTTDSDQDNRENSEGNTKCVTVEQIPLSKRLSIVNNQMQRNM